jgi:hypothetical protein
MIRAVALVNAIVFALFLVALLPFWRPTWIYGLYFLFLGGQALALLFILSFIPFAWSNVFGRSDVTSEKLVRFWGSLAFWILSVVVFFADIPSSTSPWIVLLTLVACSGLALGQTLLIVGLEFKLIRMLFLGQMIGSALLGLLAIKYPDHVSIVKFRIYRAINPAFEPTFFTMEEIEKMPELEFFEKVTGKPKVWFGRRTDGDYVLAKGQGYDPVNGKKLRPVETEAHSEEITAWLNKTRTAILKRREKEARLRKLEEERVKTEAEAKRKVEESRLAEEKRVEAERVKAEEERKRKAEEARLAEEKKLEEEKISAEKRSQEDLEKERQLRLQQLQEKERLEFLDRYLSNRALTNRGQSTEVAVVCVDEENKLRGELASLIVSLLQTNVYWFSVKRRLVEKANALLPRVSVLV